MPIVIANPKLPDPALQGSITSIAGVREGVAAIATGSFDSVAGVREGVAAIATGSFDSVAGAREGNS